MNKNKRFSGFLLLLLAGIIVWFYHGKLQLPIQQVGLHTNGNVDGNSDARSRNISRPNDLSRHGIADFSVSEIQTALKRLEDISDADQKSRFSALLRRWPAWICGWWIVCAASRIQALRFSSRFSIGSMT